MKNLVLATATSVLLSSETVVEGKRIGANCLEYRESRGTARGRIFNHEEILTKEVDST